MRRLVQKVISHWRLEQSPLRVKKSRRKISMTIDDILLDLSPSILKKSGQVSISLIDQPSSNTWQFSAVDAGDDYVVSVRALPDREDFLESLTVGDVDIEVSCSCPFWRWQGPEHHAKAEDYLYGSPRGTAASPTIKDPSGVQLLCKHATSTLEEIRDYPLDEV